MPDRVPASSEPRHVGPRANGDIEVDALRKALGELPRFRADDRTTLLLDDVLGVVARLEAE